MNKKGEFDLESINWMGVLLAIIGGLIAIINVKRMGGGLFMKIITFIIVGAVGYVIAWKIGESG